RRERPREVVALAIGALHRHDPGVRRPCDCGEHVSLLDRWRGVERELAELSPVAAAGIGAHTVEHALPQALLVLLVEAAGNGVEARDASLHLHVHRWVAERDDFARAEVAAGARRVDDDIDLRSINDTRPRAD